VGNLATYFPPQGGGKRLKPSTKRKPGGEKLKGWRIGKGLIGSFHSGLKLGKKG